MKQVLTLVCALIFFTALILTEPGLPFSKHTVPTALAQKITTEPLFRFRSDKNQYALMPGVNGQLVGFNPGYGDGFGNPVIIGHVPGGTHQLVTVMIHAALKRDDYGERYFYTDDFTEYDLKTSSGYQWKKIEGIAFYVSKTQVKGTVPLYRLWLERTVVPSGQFYTPKPGEDGWYYTTSEQEKNQALAAGYKYPRKLGYIYSSPQPPPPPGPKINTGGGPTFDPDADLLRRGCTRPSAGAYNCPTIGGYEACESYRLQQKIKGPCTTPANLKVQAAMDKLLFSVGCSRFLGRPDEFLCKTQTGRDLCKTYQNNGKVKNCHQAK
jgi:hypothetical protein